MPKHPDFQEIYDSMKKQYGKRVDEVYYAWVNKHRLNDTKPMNIQYHKVNPSKLTKKEIHKYRRVKRVHNPHSIFHNILRPKRGK